MIIFESIIQNIILTQRWTKRTFIPEGPQRFLNRPKNNWFSQLRVEFCPGQTSPISTRHNNPPPIQLKPIRQYNVATGKRSRTTFVRGCISLEDLSCFCSSGSSVAFQSKGSLITTISMTTTSRLTHPLSYGPCQESWLIPLRLTYSPIEYTRVRS